MKAPFGTECENTRLFLHGDLFFCACSHARFTGANTGSNPFFLMPSHILLTGADESSGAEVASETHGAGSDSYHGVAPADIPFGGTNDRPEREPDAAFGVEQENTSQLFGSSIRTGTKLSHRPHR